MASPSLQPDTTFVDDAAYWRNLSVQMFERVSALEEELAAVKRDLSACRTDLAQSRALHRKAIQRETALKARVRRLETRVWERDQRITELEKVEAKLRLREKQLYGRRTEKNTPAARSGKPRGKRRGQKGHGRDVAGKLPGKDVSIETPNGPPRCPHCAAAYEKLSATEDSVEIDWQVRLYRKVYRRAKYRRSCRCHGVPEIVTAPVPPKVIPKGKFSTGFWTELLTEKFCLQRPLSRILSALRLQGLALSQGTITGGLKKIAQRIRPIYGRTVVRSRGSRHWHMDETRWKVFQDRAGKKNYQWWLWVCATKEACVYWVDPSRGARVPRDHLSDRTGILSCDRYSAYKSVADQEAGIQLSYCWAHVRRDFLDAATKHKSLTRWSQDWTERIRELYARNRLRLAVAENTEERGRRQTALCNTVARMADRWDRELGQPNLHGTKRKILKSLKTHWPGLTVFLDHPEVPLDNNEAERCLRNAVVGRKNYYGSGSEWSGELAAMMFTFFDTYKMNGLNPKKALKACTWTPAQPTAARRRRMWRSSSRGICRRKGARSGR